MRGIRLSPLVKAAVTSATVMSAGDIISQSIRFSSREKLLSYPDKRNCLKLLTSLYYQIDFRQTARFGLVGLTLHGPYFHVAFRWLDATFPPLPGKGVTLPLALKKTLLGQITVFPTYLVSFFTYMGVLEGLSFRECIIKVQKAVPSTFLYGSSWIGINIINFLYVKPQWRVLYINVAGLFWNTFLSLQNATRGHVEHNVAPR